MATGDERHGGTPAPRRPRRVPRWLGGALFALALLLAGAAAALWVWSGAQGSLATTLGWAARYLPLSAEDVSGSLRGGGTAARLAWTEGGLRIELQGAELRWRPLGLLDQRLHITRLAAARVEIDDQSPATDEPGTPPASLALPLAVRVDQIEIGDLHLAESPDQALREIAAQYQFDGRTHHLTLAGARLDEGRYQGRASIGADAPLPVDAELTGTLAAQLPGAQAPMALALRASLQGPLAQLRAQADVREERGTASASGPRLHASARLAPWDAQPLTEAHAEAQDFDLARLWSQAPRTRLSGSIDLAPAGAPDAPGWAIRADLANADAGPWDQGQLPVQALRADVLWQGGAAEVHALDARVAGGSVRASGRWSASADAGWRVQAQLQAIDPARLHSQLAALPLDGRASVHASDDAIAFDAALQARAAPARDGALKGLRLKSASARGRFATGELTLTTLAITTEDAQVAGSAQLRLGHDKVPTGGSAQLDASAPGLAASVHGSLAADAGKGTAELRMADAARALAWLRTLPGAQTLLPGAALTGQAQLNARWSSGWKNPELHARLTSAAMALTPADGAAITLRRARVDLDGTLAQARLALRATVVQGERDADIDLAASGGCAAPCAQPASAAWRLALTRLVASVQEPALGPGRWRIASNADVRLTWSAAGGGRLEVGAGSLLVTSPAPATQAAIAWDPALWRPGELGTSGRVTGLPLQWAERATGGSWRDEGLTGDVLLDGRWDLALTDTLRLHAELARSSGDLAVRSQGVGSQPSEVAAGLREARATLTSDGSALALQLRWDSAHAGEASATLRSALSATRDAEGRTHWAWPATAPLQGEASARLPRIAAWATLAPPGWRLGGSLALDLRVAGTRAAPELSGSASADDLALRSVVDGIEFKGGRLRARFTGTRLAIDELSLRGAGEDGGRIVARGEAGWTDGRMQVQIDTTLERLRASIRSDRDITVSGQVRAALRERTLSASGGLAVDQALIELPDESRPELGGDVRVLRASEQRAPGAATESVGATPLNARVDLRIALGSDFRVRGMGADTRLAGTLTLSADGPLGAPPRLSGLVQTQGGRFHAYGQNLDITRGDIRFTGAPDNPQLNIIALRPNFASDQKVGVQVSGSALLPRVRLYSDPGLPDNQALAWLLLGHAAPTTGAEAAMLQSAALALLGGREGRGLAARFGLDELSVARGDNGAAASASVTLGKRLSDRLYAAYQHSLAGTGGALMIFYELSRRWSLRGQTGEDAGLDLIYRLSFD